MGALRLTCGGGAVFAGKVPLATIAHLDADAFFVSVELAKRPELRGKKVAVGGRQRGIISSASYEARAVGVYTPMPSQRAMAVCPDLILLPHEGDYGGVSRQMFDICETLTPLVQRNSIDEGYLGRDWISVRCQELAKKRFPGSTPMGSSK